MPAFKQALDLDVPLLRQRHGLGFLFDRIIRVFLKARYDPVDLVVLVGGLFRGAGDDERRPGLVDQDRVHFVHDGVVELALDVLLEVEFHVVAQIIETELVVRAVGHIRAVRRLPFLVGEPMDDDADREAEEAVNLAHPFRVAPRQVVVDGHDVHAFAFEGIQVHRQRGDQCFTLACFHFRDLAGVKNDAADKLDVEMPHYEDPFGRLSYHGKGFGQNVVK